MTIKKIYTCALTKKIACKFTSLFILPLALALPACSEFKKEKETINNLTNPTNQNKQVTSGDAKFNLQDTEIPHQYQMSITWPEDIKKVVIENDGKKIFDTDSTKQYLLVLKDNTRYNIRVFSYDSDKPILIGETAGATPKDYSLSGQIELKEDLEIEAYRVFLVNEPKILTNGKTFKIKTTKLYADEAQILSFQEGAKAPAQTDGLSGGLVHLIAKQAIGHTRINLRGQHGGDGLHGLPWETRANDGGGGRSGAHDCARASFVGGPLKCWCTRNPGHGEDGQAGAKGRSGTSAGRGGHSGKILVEVTEPSEFAVEPYQEIGLAGIPGKGGPGQEGGIGGAPGDPTSGECPSARSGNKGATGSPGDDAPASLDGSTEQLCISIGQGEGKCQTR